MNLINLLKKIIDPNHCSNEAYINYIKRNNIYVGDHSFFYSPRHTSVDIQKPHLVSIGSY